jgi:hypothetical protein
VGSAIHPLLAPKAPEAQGRLAGRDVTLLPNERAAAKEVSRQLGAELKRAAAFHEMATAPLVRVPLRFKKKRGLDQTVVGIAIGLYVRALKQHRAIQVLARRGMGHEALALSRNLFETTVAIAWLLRHRLALQQGGVKVPGVPGFPLTTWFRARLFLANLYLEEERTAGEWSRTPGLRRVGARTFPSSTTRVAKVTAVIGQEWTRRLRASRSYSGLSLKNLAASLRLSPAYATHYRAGSWSTHPVQLVRHIELNPNGPATIHLSPNLSDVEPAVETANVLLMACLEFLNDRLGLSLEAKISSQRKALGLRPQRGPGNRHLGAPVVPTPTSP